MTHLKTNEELVELSRSTDTKVAARALGQLVEQNIGLVISQARGHGSWYVPEEDLVREGTLGILEAAKRFDQREAKFTTYAVYWIRNFIDLALRQGVARTDRQKHVFYRSNRAVNQLRAEGVYDPTDAQIAERVGAREQDVVAVRTQDAMNRPYEPPRRNDGTPLAWQDILEDSGPSPEEQLVEVTEHRRRMFALNDALGELSPRERTIVLRHYLSDSDETFGDIGADLGISRQRVKQIETQAFAKMRDYLTRELEAA